MLKNRLDDEMMKLNMQLNMVLTTILRIKCSLFGCFYQRYKADTRGLVGFFPYCPFDQNTQTKDFNHVNNSET